MVHSFKIKLIILFVFSNSLSFAQYSTEYLAASRSRIATAQFDDEIFFIAGSIDNGTGYAQVDRVNTLSNTWTSETFISDGASTVQVDQNEDYMMLSQLTDVNLLLGDLVKYERATDTWTRLNYSGTIYGSAATVVFDNYFWVTQGDLNNNLGIYNFLTNSWSSSTVPFSRDNVMTVQYNNKLFFAGGRIGSTKQTDVNVYDIATQNWSSFNLTETRDDNPLTELAYFLYQNKLVIAGGWTGNSSGTRTDLIEVVDLDTYTIDTYKLSKAKEDLCGCAVNDVLVFGGGNSTELEAFDLKTGGKLVYDLGAQSNLDELECGVVGNTVILAGGNDTEGDTVYVYNANFHSLNKVALPFSRNEVVITSLNDKLYIAGGEDPNNITTDEVICIEELDDCTLSITHTTLDNITGTYRASGDINSTANNPAGNAHYISETLVSLDSGFESNGIYDFIGEIGDCEPICNINLNYTDTPCNPGPTCSNFDDSYTFSITPTTIGGGTNFDISGDYNQSNVAFGTTINFSQLIKDGPMVFNIEDLSTGCIFPFNIIPPDFCSINDDVYICTTAYEMTQSCVYSAPGPTEGDGCFDCSGNTDHANWFSFTATSNTTVSIESCQSTENTNLYVYEGDCTNLVQIADDSNDCFPGAQILNIPVVAGTQYFFEWDDRYDDDPFEFTFTIN